MAFEWLFMGLLAQWAQVLEATFWLVGLAMLASGLVVLLWFPGSREKAVHSKAIS
jgi:hypothetical protein